MKINTVLLVTLIIVSCKSQSDVKYIPQGKSHHVIDFKYFEVKTPKSYKYIAQKGIDSYVGKISNGEITFTFDFGWYSFKGPRTFYEDFSKHFNFLYLETFMDSFNLARNDGSISTENIEILNSEYIENGRFTSTIRLDSTTYIFNSISQQGGEDDNLKNYEISTEFSEIQYKKIYIPKTQKDSTIGAYLEDLRSKKENLQAYNKLSFYTSQYQKEDLSEVLSILESLKLK